MRELFLCALLILFSSQLSNTLALNVNRFEEKLANYQSHLPTGDIKQTEYVKKLIDYMYNFDQEIRELFIKDLERKEIGLLLKKLDSLHTSKMKEILKEWGWITISKFGLEYDKKAWLLVQHADEDPFFQAGILFLLENLASKGETDKKNYAYLYDRVAVKLNQVGVFQKYGTQVYITKEDIKLQPYEGSLEDIDKRRSEIGLEPLADYLKKIKEIHKL